MTFLPTQGLGGIAGQMLPQGMNGIGAALGAASPLLLAMSAGMRSGDGAMSQMPMGLLMMQQQQKLKREEEAKTAAAGAYGSWNAVGGASGLPAAMGASNTPAPPSGPLAGAMADPSRHSSSPSMARGMPDFAKVEQEFRLPAGYLARTAQIESGGNPNAQNPKSSAGGLFQFIDSTAAQYGVDKFDPHSSTIGAARLAADNASHLRQALGREPTSGELYLAHQQGAGGAAKLLLNPNAKAADIVGTEAVRLNGGDPATWTAGDFARRWQGEYGETQPANPAQDPQVRGMIDWLAQHGEADPARAAAVKMQLEMRIAQLQAQSEGQGITDMQAAQLGLQEAGQQPGPMTAEGRYKVVGGALVDLYAEGGPKPVFTDQGEADPMSTIGKLYADLQAGRISQELFDLEIQRMAPSGQEIVADGNGGFTLRTGPGVGAAGGALKPPVGYAVTPQPDGTATLAPVKGGPGTELPAELAARIAVADDGLKVLPSIIERAANGDLTGALDWAWGTVGRGQQGKDRRDIKGASEAITRLLTGAGMNNAEVAAEAWMYTPTATDDAATVVHKLTRLYEKLESAKAMALTGRGGAVAVDPNTGLGIAPPPGAPAQPQRLRFNPDTGELE
jgi:hypothetical protein